MLTVLKDISRALSKIYDFRKKALSQMFDRVIKRGTHLGFNAIKVLKEMSLALLTQVENIILKMLKHFYCF